MTNHKKLKKYIRRAHKKGFSVAKITQTLLKTGWTQEQIKKGFKIASKRSVFIRFFHSFLNIFKR